MLAEFFTKTIKGSKFKLFRRVLMEWYYLATLWDNSNERTRFHQHLRSVVRTHVIKWVWMIDTQIGMKVIYIIVTNTGMQACVLGLE